MSLCSANSIQSPGLLPPCLCDRGLLGVEVDCWPPKGRASQKSLCLAASPHPRVIKSVVPVLRGRAKPATRSCTLFWGGEGKRKKTFEKPCPKGTKTLTLFTPCAKLLLGEASQRPIFASTNEKDDLEDRAVPNITFVRENIQVEVPDGD